MTASIVKTTKLTQAVASPNVMADPRQNAAFEKVSVETLEAATTSLDEAGDAILLLPIHSSALVNSVVLFNDDLDSGGTAGAVDVGVYNGPEAFVDTDTAKTAKAAYVVLDADSFASAITTLTAANTAGVEIGFEARDIANAEKPLWQLVGLDSDPNKLFCIGITVTTAMTTPVAGTITVRVKHS